MAGIEIHILEAFVGFTLTDCQFFLLYSVLFDDLADMTVIEDDSEDREERVGRDEKETVIEKGLEIEGKTFEGSSIFFNQIERD